MEIYIGWWLLLPAVLYIVRGCSSLRVIAALGYSRKCTLRRRLLYILPEMLLFSLWCMLELHLTAVYILAFVCHAFRWCGKRGERSGGFFMVSLFQPLFMALHMTLIGMCSLMTDSPMGLLLSRPAWRIAVISSVAVFSILSDMVILKWPRLQETLRLQALSEEKRPFMVFLWFCNIFLLLDSLLCMTEISWSLLPLLLIGAAVLKEFIIVRCLFHLDSVIKERPAENQHRVLTEKLEQQERRTEELKKRGDKDALTGLFSRRYLMEQTEQLLSKQRLFTLAFIDLDGLKSINDTQGHDEGDRYLLQFSRYISGQIRENDIFARIGGDEFVILFADCNEADAVGRLEKIRSGTAEGQFEHVPSFSYGTAAAAAGAQESVAGLLELADRNMYRDKGRRRQEGFSE